MYYYVYDSFIKRDKAASKALEQVNLGLMNKGMLGETAEASAAQPVSQLVRDGVERGHKTIVVAGDNRTLQEAANVLVDVAEDVALGLIPIGGDVSLARVFGLTDFEGLAQTLISRNLSVLDVGMVNDQVFLGSLDFYANEEGRVLEGRRSGQGIFGRARRALSRFSKVEVRDVRIDVNRTFSVTARTPHFSFINLRPVGAEWDSAQSGDVAIREQASEMFHFNDERLDLFVLNELTGTDLVRYGESITAHGYEDIPHTTFLRGDRFVITSNDDLDLWADGVHVGTTPAQVEIVPKQLRVIVGKHRLVV